MISKNNVPYYTAGTLATLTFLASGVFAVAPYAQFLAPVAALSVGLPFIIGCAVFSAVAIALSAVVISKNNTISEKDAQLAKEGKFKVAIADGTVQLANLAVSLTKEAANGTWDLSKYVWNNYVPSTESAKEKLSNAFDAVGNGLRNTYSVMPSVEFAKGTLGSGVKSIYDTSVGYTMEKLNAVGSGVNKVYNAMPSIESTKGTLGSGVKSIYDTSVASVRGALNSVGSSLYSRIYGTKVSSPEEQFEREDGSKLSMQELTHLDYLDLAVPSSEQKQRANSLGYLNIDNVPKQPDHLSIDAAKRYLMSLSEDQDVFYDAESGDEKGTEISSLKEQLDENSKAKVPSRISDLCESVKRKFTSFWSGVQSVYVVRWEG